MSRFYGETIDKRIRLIANIILFCLICTLISCKKEETQICKTCTVTTTIDPAESGALVQTYIESQTEYCNHESDTIKQGQIYYKKTSIDGGQTWTVQSKTRTCE